MTAERYPLTWPSGWKRTTYRTETPFKHQGGTILTQPAMRRLSDELRRIGAKDEILSTNVPVRVDGSLRLNERTGDVGVAVYFTLKGKPRCLACDRYNTVAGNIAAVAAHIDALRRIDRYGVGTLDQAFAGYTALPPSADEDWHLILGVSRKAPLDAIEASFITLAKTAHPDVGGSHDEMARLTAARAAARRAKGV